MDRWAETHPDKVAILWEGDEPNMVERITFHELLQRVCQFANLLKKYNVKKGDRVTIYMPMIPQAAIAMLACTRIGAVHSVVFAGFSASALRDRILDAKSATIVTSDQGIRGGKVIKLKDIVDEAISGLKDPSLVENVLMFERLGQPINFVEKRDVWAHTEMLEMRPYCVCSCGISGCFFDAFCLKTRLGCTLRFSPLLETGRKQR